MIRRVSTLALVATLIISLGGWFWFLGVTARWLILKL
jgi:hypothetical protein